MACHDTRHHMESRTKRAGPEATLLPKGPSNACGYVGYWLIGWDGMKVSLGSSGGFLGTGLARAVGWAGVWAGLSVFTGDFFGNLLGAGMTGAALGFIGGGKAPFPAG